jgi:hypothetical protein
MLKTGEASVGRAASWLKIVALITAILGFGDAVIAGWLWGTGVRPDLALPTMIGLLAGISGLAN